MNKHFDKAIGFMRIAAACLVGVFVLLGGVIAWFELKGFDHGKFSVIRLDEHKVIVWPRENMTGGRSTLSDTVDLVITELPAVDARSFAHEALPQRTRIYIDLIGVVNREADIKNQIDSYCANRPPLNRAGFFAMRDAWGQPSEAGQTACKNLIELRIVGSDWLICNSRSSFPIRSLKSRCVATGNFYVTSKGQYLKFWIQNASPDEPAISKQIYSTRSYLVARIANPPK